MISAWVIGCNASPSGNVVQKNPMPPLKKKHFEVCTSSFGKVRPLITGRNRFAGRKNLSNTGDTPPFRNGEIDAEILALVTTSHLLLQSALGKIVILLPFWLRNPGNAGSPAGEIVAWIPLLRHPSFLASKCTDEAEGGGGQRRAFPRTPRWISSHGIFITKGAPLYSNEHSGN